MLHPCPFRHFSLATDTSELTCSNTAAKLLIVPGSQSHQCLPKAKFRWHCRKASPARHSAPKAAKDKQALPAASPELPPPPKPAAKAAVPAADHGGRKAMDVDEPATKAPDKATPSDSSLACASASACIGISPLYPWHSFAMHTLPYVKSANHDGHPTCCEPGWMAGTQRCQCRTGQP